MRGDATKARTKKNISEIYAWWVCLNTSLGFIIMAYFLIVKDLKKSVNDFGFTSLFISIVIYVFFMLGTLAVSFFSGHYALALREKRLSVVQTLYRIWWFFGLILFISVLLVLILIAILALRKGEPVVEGAVILFSILLSFTILLGVPTVFYWMGLRGLQEMAKDFLVLGAEMLKIENKTF